eukprot:Gb_24603 [translate_table: standard]
MAKILVQANGDTSSPRSCSSPDRESSPESSIVGSDSGICSLRGVQWRVKLGVLPAITSSIDDLRRAAANGRRNYADLRRRLLVDPHVMEETQKAADLSMDNPLSQNPESVWGRFFRNAELERTIDNDLSRLYPEHGSYFQTPACQAMLRRILLLRSLRHPEHSYRQGMHELLAPLLYVLHVDVMHLSQLKHLYEDLFDDRFEDLSFQESNICSSDNLQKRKNALSAGISVIKVADEDKVVNDFKDVESFTCQANLGKLSSTDELDTDIMSIYLGSDAYGAEGELGALLSLRFMEHDAYCMFDALLSGKGGVVAMADYFMNSPAVGSVTGSPPVIEASADIYNLLAVADMSLYSHLVELGVEPQYFALRWLRVLFGREFVLEDLLLLWDAIFTASNSHLPSHRADVLGNNILWSPRSAFISAMAVSMLLHLRSSLLATPNATTCLQKLLNFPRNTDVKKLIENAKLLQSLAMDSSSTTSPQTGKMSRNFDSGRVGKLVRSASASPPGQIPVFSHKGGALQHQKSSPCSPVPESYWEEKWRTSVLQKVVPEESLGRGVEVLGKGLAGQVDGKNSMDASGQQHTVSADGTEAKESRKENDSSLLKDETESVSNSTDHKCKNGTYSGKSSRRKLLDDLAESFNSQIESNMNQSSLINGKKVDVPSTSDVYEAPKQSTEDGNDGKHLSGDCFAKPNNQTMSTVTRSDYSKGPNPVMVSDDQKNGCSNPLPFDRRKEQQSDILASHCHALLINNSEGAKVSTSDIDRRHIPSMAAGEKLLTRSGDGNYGSCQLNSGESSPRSTSEVSLGKAATADASQTGRASEVSRKQKPSSAAHFGKFRWMWNFGRNTGAEKDNSEISKTEPENISFDGRHESSEESSVIHAKSDIVDSSLPLVLENSGDGHSCNSDIQSPKQANCIIPEPLINNSEALKVSKDKNPPTTLRTLGQSMLENIQVIESAFSQGCCVMNKDGTQEKGLEHSSRNFLGGKGQVAALVALTELRKISNILSQM